MTKDITHNEIALLIYPDSLLSAIYGLTDLFYVANTCLAKHGDTKRSPIRVTHWKQDPNMDNAVQCIYDTEPDIVYAPMMIVCPPSLIEPVATQATLPITNWLHQHHENGTVMTAVCGGSFLLAEAGLLKGRRATTHWGFTAAMAKRYPDIQVDGDKMVIDDGDIITAGGFMAWTDLGLRLVHRLLGPTIMLETARFMLIDPPGREQTYYSSFNPNLHHGDAAILRVQHWLQINGAKDVDVPMMAAQAAMEERTFLRRFQKATGLKPTEYCQQLRVNKAREMLEFTQQNIEQISWMVGYEDAGAFRKVFHKVVGLTPGQYRERFGILNLQQGVSA